MGDKQSIDTSNNNATANRRAADKQLADLNHHTNQLNPNSDAYRAARDNRANQLNPNNDKA